MFGWFSRFADLRRVLRREEFRCRLGGKSEVQSAIRRAYKEETSMRFATRIGIIALLLAIASTAVVSTSFACPNDKSDASDSSKDGE